MLSIIMYCRPEEAENATNGTPIATYAICAQCRTAQHKTYHQEDQDHLMLLQRHCLTPSAHPCTQTARLVGYQSSVFHIMQPLDTAKHNQLRLWAMVAMSDRPRPLNCMQCLSRQELVQKTGGTSSSRPEFGPRPAPSDTAKRQSQLKTHLAAAPKKPFTGGMVFSLAIARRTSSASLADSALSAASCTSSLSLLYLSSKSYTTDHTQSDRRHSRASLPVLCRQGKLVSYLLH